MNEQSTKAGKYKNSRRDFCASALLLTAQPISKVYAQGPNTSPTKSLSEDVAHYIKLGEHRAGTEVELQTAQWLQQRLQKLGYANKLDAFPITTLLQPSGELRIGETAINAFPQWLPPATSLGQSMSNRLLPLDAQDTTPAIRIVTKAVAFTANWIPRLDVLVAEAKAKNAIALVLAIEHSADGLFVCNQHSHDAFPIPVALVSKQNLKALVESTQISSGPQAQLQLLGKLTKASAYNVVGQKAGIGKAIVISTPLTGWFHCGAERGPGIALWLRIAAVLSKSQRPVVLLGTGCHEVGHFGMDYALTSEIPKPNEVALWLHFGASLGATKLDAQFRFKSPQALVGRPATEAIAKTTLSANLPIYVPGNATTLGEAGQVIAAGYEHFVGMSGFFPGFHTIEDKGEAIDFEILDKIAQGSEDLISRVMALAS
jgi:hypothetical protein